MAFDDKFRLAGHDNIRPVLSLASLPQNNELK